MARIYAVFALVVVAGALTLNHQGFAFASLFTGATKAKGPPEQSHK
ncbi:hypothetical protein [Zavarzinia compransoris]|nr:hypothetical protein [Zavarzinia compransoris]TDP47731.1 hypothetical protein DES42_10225 [Zavarzinia compransoris]